MTTYDSSEMRTRRSQFASGSSGGGSANGGGGWANGGGGSGGSWADGGGNSGGGSWSSSAASANGSGGDDRWSSSSTGATHGGIRDDDKNKSSGILGMSTELKLTYGLILLTAIFLHADQNCAAPNLSAIANDFEMTPMQKDTRLGGMVQFGFFLIGGAVSLLVGPAADQVDRITMLSLVVLSGCVPSLLMSMFVPSSKAGFFYFFMARICTGIAVGGSFPVLFSLAADLFPPSQRGFVAASLSAATNIGAAVGGMMAGIVGPRFGWRVPFRAVAIPALVCAVLCRLFLKDPRTLRREKQAREATSVNNPAFAAWSGGEEVKGGSYVRMEDLDFGKFKRILLVRTNVLVFAQCMPGCIPLSCIVTFLADYLAVEKGMKVQASTAVTAAFGVSCLCFAVSGSMLGQWLYDRRKDQLPMLLAATTSFAALPFLALVNSPQTAVTSAEGRPTAFAFLLALLGGAAAVGGPNIRCILMNVNDSAVRGTAFSAFTLMDDLGKGLGPTFIVGMTAIFGRRLAYSLAFLCWLLSGVILFSMRTVLPRDAARSGGSVLPFKNQ
eukprot:TRINITY_DN60942_c0_g1_i1.p1 TRINITY_DN60942_c0_g1~~TRINITY_DN60942_c0_g1_i1.p1  ORF type:complete len:555 (+),score=87.69 TRINITY_DN60942_c0_g1_i1:258-1922(+)